MMFGYLCALFGYLCVFCKDKGSCTICGAGQD